MSISQFLLNEDRDPLPRPTRMSISGLLWNQYPEPGTGPGRSVSNNNQTGHSTMNIPTQGPANSDQGHLPVTNRAIIAPSQNIIIPRNTVRNIAPRPQIISWPEKPIDDLEAKKELKKIRKREAAARCYQRKLAKRKANSSQDKTWHIHYCTVPTNLLCGARIYSSLTRSIRISAMQRRTMLLIFYRWRNLDGEGHEEPGWIRRFDENGGGGSLKKKIDTIEWYFWSYVCLAVWGSKHRG